MSKYYKSVKEAVLGSWNKESFIVLLEEENKNDDFLWEDILAEIVIPKFEMYTRLTEEEIEQLVQEIGRIWNIEEYLKAKKYLDFLDNEVRLEDFERNDV